MSVSTNIVAKYSGDPFVDPERSPEVDVFAQNAFELSKRIEGILVVSVGGGAGNRGAEHADEGMARVRADQNGMLASMQNAATLAERLKSLGARVYGFKPFPHTLVESELGAVEGNRVNRALTFESAGQTLIKASKERALIIAGGGTGFGRVSTDSGAVLWAVNLCNPDSGFDTVILKGTSVKGVYDRDPREHDNAVLYPHVNYDFCIANGTGVMDRTVWPTLKDADITTRIFKNGPGNLLRAFEGDIGSVIDNASMTEAYRA